MIAALRVAKAGTFLVALAVGFSGYANAALFKITYTGTITSGFDYGGMFYAPGTDLTGVPYSDEFILDTSTGAMSFDNGVTSSIDGLNNFSPITAKLTINGVSFQYGNKPLTHGSASQSNFFDGSNHAVYDEVSHYVQDFDNGAYFNYNWNRITSFDNNIVDTSDYTANLYYAAQPLDRLDGAFLVWQSDPRFIGYPACGGFSCYASGGLRPETVRIEGIAAPSVPEPATWAMMIAGFGSVGSARRFLRRTAKLAHA